MDCVLGVDFDNTIVCYDELMHRVALEKHLIDPDIRVNKKNVRDEIRKRPDGEIEWQKLQAMVYGPLMHEARIFDGAETFFKTCTRLSLPVHIISHKTEFASYDTSGTSLRKAALNWMSVQGFFDSARIGLSPEVVYFESTRQEKINRIKQLACTHFIDDLEETFQEAGFPHTVLKFLFTPHAYDTSLKNVNIITSWQEITHYFFAGKP